MNNTGAMDLLIALMQASEDYRVETVVPLVIAGAFGYRSHETRTLMDMLASLDMYDDHPEGQLLLAVNAIITYINTVGLSEKKMRGFWVKHLQPCLERYAINPPADLTDEFKNAVFNLELAPYPCTKQITKQRGMLFNVFRTKAKLAEHFSLNNTTGITKALEGNTPGAARILHAAFECNTDIPGRIFLFPTTAAEQASTSAFRYQGHPLMQLLELIDHDELLIFLKSVKSNHPSINLVTPSLLYKIADRQAEQTALAAPYLSPFELPHTRYAREAQLTNFTLNSIDSLKEIKRITTWFNFSKKMNYLYAIVTGNPQCIFETITKSNEELAAAIAENPLWKNELMNENSTIYLENIVPAVEAMNILALLKTNQTASNRIR
jgi:hypothetical protein